MSRANNQYESADQGPFERPLEAANRHGDGELDPPPIMRTSRFDISQFEVGHTAASKQNVERIVLAQGRLGLSRGKADGTTGRRNDMISEQVFKRKWIALAICLVSATLALLAWHHGERAWLALGLLAWVWGFTADWLGGQLWLSHKSVGQFYKTIRETGLEIFWLPPLARAISLGAMIFAIASLATCVFGP